MSAMIYVVSGSDIQSLATMLLDRRMIDEQEGPDAQ